MKEDYQRALELPFTYGYGCCVFKRDIHGDQPEVPDCMSGSPNFLSPKWFASLVYIVKRWQRSLREVPPSGIKWNILSSTFSSTFSSFRNGPNMVSWTYTIM